MDRYTWPCGCELVEDTTTGEVVTTRCAEHKVKFPHRLDKEAR